MDQNNALKCYHAFIKNQALPIPRVSSLIFLAKFSMCSIGSTAARDDRSKGGHAVPMRISIAGVQRVAHPTN